MEDFIPVEIVVESIVVCERSDIISGFAIMMAAYYVVNIAYPKELKSTLFFYQKAFLDVNEARVTTRRFQCF